MNGLEHMEDRLDKVEYLQNLLVARATGGEANDGHYQIIRQELLNSPVVSEMLPRWIKTNRNLSQFWEFIKAKYPSYAERRRFVWDAFNPILEFVESGLTHPAKKDN